MAQRLWSVLTLAWVAFICWATFGRPDLIGKTELACGPPIFVAAIWFAGRFILTGRWTAK